MGLLDVRGVDNWEAVDMPGSGGGISLPPGYWPAVITQITKRTPNKGGSEYVAIELMVTAGTDKTGTVFTDNIHVDHEKDVVRKIAASRIRSLMVAVGKDGCTEEDQFISEEVIVEIRASVNKTTNQPGVNVHAYHSKKAAEDKGIKLGSNGSVVTEEETKPEPAPVKAKPWQKK